MAGNRVWYFFVHFGTFGISEDSKTPLGVLGATFGRFLGVLVASLWCNKLGHYRLGLDLAKLG